MGANREAANRAALGLTNGSGAFGNMEDSSRSAGGGAPRNGYHSMEEQAVVDKALKTHQDTTASALRAAKVNMPRSQVGGCWRCLPQNLCIGLASPRAGCCTSSWVLPRCRCEARCLLEQMVCIRGFTSLAKQRSFGCHQAEPSHVFGQRQVAQVSAVDTVTTP